MESLSFLSSFRTVLGCSCANNRPSSAVPTIPSALSVPCQTCRHFAPGAMTPGIPATVTSLGSVSRTVAGCCDHPQRHHPITNIAFNTFLALKSMAIPIGKFRAGFVGAVAEGEHSLIGRFGAAHIIIFQDEQCQLFIPVRCCRTDEFFRQSSRTGSSVGIKRSLLKAAVARPEAATDDFMRISLPGDGVRLRSFRSTPAGKACHRQIKRT